MVRREKILTQQHSRIKGPAKAKSPRQAAVLGSHPLGASRALEFERRCTHVARLLRLRDLDGSAAPEWVLAFWDEDDPLMVIPEWLTCGWRDPLLVNAVLRICDDRETAEKCLASLGRGP